MKTVRDAYEYVHKRAYRVNRTLGMKKKDAYKLANRTAVIEAWAFFNEERRKEKRTKIEENYRKAYKLFGEALKLITSEDIKLVRVTWHRGNGELLTQPRTDITKQKLTFDFNIERIHNG